MVSVEPNATTIEMLITACERLVNAAEMFAADQSTVKDRRIGLVQPVSADDCEELNAAITKARDVIAEIKCKQANDAPR
jgi:hypothetical protein